MLIVRLRKIIIAILAGIILLAGCNTKQEEKECPKCENKIEEKVMLRYNDKELTEEKVMKIYNEKAFYYLLEEIESELLYKEFNEKEIKKAQDYAEQTIKELKEYYDDELTAAIQENTDYQNATEYQEYIEYEYLKEKYVENYVKEKNISDEEFKNSYYKISFEADKYLYEKNELKFEDKELQKAFNSYIEEMSILAEEYDRIY